jgi:signal transduction histidine kinase/integral membrane sensor domain MASE1
MAPPRVSLGLIRNIVALAVLYTGIAKLGLMLDAVSGFATLVWPPTGLALAALLLFGSRLWPGVWLGAFVVNVWVGASWPVAIGIATGNTLEAIIGTYALSRWAGFEGSFDRLRHVIGLLLPVALGSTMVSATLGVSSLVLGGVISADRMLETWRAWWVGDMLGALVVAPLIFTWRRPLHWKASLIRLVEGLFLAGGVTAASLAVFLRPPGEAYNPFASPYVLFPFFVWAAVRFELRGAATATALASGLAVWGTTRGLGPFVRERLASSLLALQTFMACVAVTPLVVGAAISDRIQAVRDRDHLVNRFRTLALASRSFAESNLELPDLLRKIAQHVVEALGDVCVVRVLTGDGSQPDVVSIHHADPKALALLRKAVEDGHETGLEVPRSGVLPSDTSFFLPIVSQDDFRSSAPAKLWPYFDGFRIRSFMAVPLRDHDRITGSIVAARTSRGFPYAVEDRSLLEELSDRAGFAIRDARLHQDLKVALQARDDFLAVASHELKTPLAALLMQLQSLQRAAGRAAPPARVEQRIDKAARSGVRLERLVNQLLDVSRITAGRLGLEPELVNLTEVAKEVIERFREAGDPQAGSIILRCFDAVNGQWDRSRIEQVVTNLLSNAVKYGQGKPVEVSLSGEGGAAVLRVEDHGIGIDEEHQKKIFQRFERAVAARDFGGLGLGLWIAGQIVEASGGKIEVTSVPGRGSTFTVRLPMNPNDVATFKENHARS